ncbi:hypothetical protein NTE_02531 [Candidatus Nitrososphaera evergladensis SR1]|uniref:Uncharacterized protein n=1 Tax=Candidatus Nitrososphaera evergladensis SR1 TaxID=1459636 RepID=A0A075MTV8_9ARCH|nr:hypothetical protein [Candidatus Nitrososphaera evergladensis]AIF84578.1 hypothetical protein NTE_02531 [Candidatus Nitrososphaera evergladensis SR1]
MSEEDPRRTALYQRLQVLGVNVSKIKDMEITLEALLELTERLEEIIQTDKF